MNWVCLHEGRWQPAHALIVVVGGGVCAPVRRLQQDTFFIGRLINKAMRASPVWSRVVLSAQPFFMEWIKNAHVFFSINLYLKQAECFDI